MAMNKHENRTIERAGGYENRTTSRDDKRTWVTTEETVRAAELKCSELIDRASVPCGDVWKLVYAVLCPPKLPPGATNVMRHCRERMRKYAFFAAGQIVSAKLDSIIAVDGPFAADYEPAIEQNKAILEQQERLAEQAHEAKMMEESERLVAEAGGENGVGGGAGGRGTIN